MQRVPDLHHGEAQHGKNDQGHGDLEGDLQKRTHVLGPEKPKPQELFMVQHPVLQLGEPRLFGEKCVGLVAAGRGEDAPGRRCRVDRNSEDVSPLSLSSAMDCPRTPQFGTLRRGKIEPRCHA